MKEFTRDAVIKRFEITFELSRKAMKRTLIDIAIKVNSPLPPAKRSMIEEKLEESSIIQKVDVVDYHRIKDDFKKFIDNEGIKLH